MPYNDIAHFRLMTTWIMNIIIYINYVAKIVESLLSWYGNAKNC